MDETPKVTEPVVEPTKSEEAIPQSQVNGIVAKEVKLAQEKILKDLGVEDIKSAKDGIAKAKELRDAQKSELEKALELVAEKEQKIAKLEELSKDRELNDNMGNVLKEMGIDTKKSSLVKKLIDTNDLFAEEGFNGDLLKERVSKVIDEELPELKTQNDTPTFGVPKVEKEINANADNDFMTAYEKLKKQK